MLILLALHIIVSFVCLCSGILFYKLFSQKAESHLFYLISGLILLTGFIQLIILFLPSAWQVQLSFATAMILFILGKWREIRQVLIGVIADVKQWSVNSRILFFVCWAIILLINSGQTIMDDTESYHIQSIKWIQEYGTVPGLVNLHERYGFNSSWFSTVALFCFSNKFSGGFTLLNGILSLWLSFWFISKFEQFRREKNIPIAFAVLMTFIVCLLVWPLIRGNAATTNYDFITTCIILVLFTGIALSKEKEIPVSIEWFIWPVYLFTVRIINFPLFLLSLIGLIFLLKQKNHKLIFLSTIFCIMLITPFIIRNVIITGFPFYPATVFEWFDVDWKPDPQITKSLLEYIKYYNRVATTYLDIGQTKALGSAWIPSWFKHMFYFDKAIVIAGLLGLLLSTLRLFIISNKYDKKLALIITISFAWLVCWFLIAPDPRFVYGIFLVGIFLLFYFFILNFKNENKIKSLLNISVIVLIAGSGFYFVSKIWKQSEYRNWILPERLSQPPTQQFTVDGIIFRIPEPINNNWNPRCFGTELPCVYDIHPKLKARGKNIRSGFHLEK